MVSFRGGYDFKLFGGELFVIFNTEILAFHGLS